eukprot:9091478-Pyramimonas_sp.AAC.1
MKSGGVPTSCVGDLPRNSSLCVFGVYFICARCNPLGGCATTVLVILFGYAAVAAPYVLGRLARFWGSADQVRPVGQFGHLVLGEFLWLRCCWRVAQAKKQKTVPTCL